LALLTLSSAALAEPAEHTSFGLLLEHNWFAPEDSDATTPTVNQLGAWFLRDLSPILSVGGSVMSTVFLFGCREEPGCYPYHLLRLGPVAELRAPLTASEHQALEVFGSVGPELVRFARGETERRTAWGVGATARGGIRVRMRWLTVGPYGDVTVFGPGSHFGWGFGLQLGVRLTD
jgi:hypothetical protein